MSSVATLSQRNPTLGRTRIRKNDRDGKNPKQPAKPPQRKNKNRRSCNRCYINHDRPACIPTNPSDPTSTCTNCQKKRVPCTYPGQDSGRVSLDAHLRVPQLYQLLLQLDPSVPPTLPGDWDRGDIYERLLQARQNTNQLPPNNSANPVLPQLLNNPAAPAPAAAAPQPAAPQPASLQPAATAPQDSTISLPRLNGPHNPSLIPQIVRDNLDEWIHAAEDMSDEERGAVMELLEQQMEVLRSMRRQDGGEGENEDGGDRMGEA